ncbi:MAG: prepilin-type N-terminal cleavage/methylation domain-containing protein [Betaproteobacteria bacterium]|nr:prepilin-type N-terminal cleavage/methylation domain-containing protein [Betaproteobacteria bacterium]
MSRGFTLIELLLTIAIIGIAAGIISLSVRGAETRKLTEEGDRLAALFRMAASEARVGGRTLVWQADLAGYSFRPLVADSSYDLREELARSRTWGVEVRAVNAHELMFTREPLRNPATVEIATADHRLRLALDAMGNPRTECMDSSCAASR